MHFFEDFSTLTNELKRKDINASGISKLAFILYKLYPGLFVKIMCKLKKGR